MVQVHYDLVDTIAGEIFGDVANEWLSENRYRGFSAVFSEWPEACAVTGGKNDRPHYEALEASRMTRSKVPGATLRKRVLRLRDTATLMVGSVR